MLNLKKLYEETTKEPAVSDTTFKVAYTTVVAVAPHGNAERLSVVTVYGFQVITQKDRYKVGDGVIFVPPDSVLPEWLEARLFAPDAKVKLHKRRVRQIRLRGLASQGMIIDPTDLADKLPRSLSFENDLKEVLEIVKYEPPAPGLPSVGGSRGRNRKADNPLFHRMNGVENIKWLPNMFAEGEEVVVQEKLHGTNARAGILPYAPTTLWKKIKKWLGLAPAYENCYGSNNVEISSKMMYKGYYGEDIYGATFKSIDVFSKLQPGESVFGEIIGPSVQKGYDYGLTEHKFVLFDVKVLMPDGRQRWLTPEEVENFAKDRGFDYVPVLYKGPYNKEQVKALTLGNSEYGDKSQKVREGIVIKGRAFYDNEGNKRALKWVSEIYLDSDQTDFH